MSPETAGTRAQRQLAVLHKSGKKSIPGPEICRICQRIRLVFCYELFPRFAPSDQVYEFTMVLGRKGEEQGPGRT